MIQRFVQDPLAMALLEGKFQEGDRIEANLSADKESVVFEGTSTPL